MQYQDVQLQSYYSIQVSQRTCQSKAPTRCPGQMALTRPNRSKVTTIQTLRSSGIDLRSPSLSCLITIMLSAQSFGSHLRQIRLSTQGTASPTNSPCKVPLILLLNIPQRIQIIVYFPRDLPLSCETRLSGHCSPSLPKSQLSLNLHFFPHITSNSGLERVSTSLI